MSNSRAPTILCVQITGTDQEMRRFLAKYPQATEASHSSEGLVTIEVFIPEPLVEKVAEMDLKAVVVYDASARGRERQKEVGRGNRFEGANRVPRGLGIRGGGPTK